MGGDGFWREVISPWQCHPEYDYGIVARFINKETGTPVVIVAGLSSYAPAAAGEFDGSQPTRGVSPFAPKGWENRNLEAVVSTRVIDGKHSRPFCGSS